MIPATSLPLAAMSAMLVASHQRFVGRPLLPPGIAEADSARWLYEEARFGVLAHNSEGDPRFIYANKAGCFEYSWEEFLALPSRLSAEAPGQIERERLLDAVTRDGFASGYRGVRVAKSGRRFWIEEVVIWRLVDASGATCGQGATFQCGQDV
jgi:hypothetical protein